MLPIIGCAIQDRILTHEINPYNPLDYFEPVMFELFKPGAIIQPKTSNGTVISEQRKYNTSPLMHEGLCISLCLGR